MMTDSGPVRVLIEVGASVAVVTFDRWAPPELAALPKAHGAKWHRSKGPVPRCWTLPPAAARDLADALAAAGAVVTRRVVLPRESTLAALVRPFSAQVLADMSPVAELAARLRAIAPWWEYAAQRWEDLPAELLETAELLERVARPGAPAEPLPLLEPLCPPGRPDARAERLDGPEPLGTPARPAVPAGPLKAPDPLKASDWEAAPAVPLNGTEPLSGPGWDAADAAPLQAVEPLQSGAGDRER